MPVSKKFLMAALLVAGFSLSFAPQAKAQQAPSQQQLDGTIDAFKNLPPEQRQQMLNSAMDAFKNMPEDQRQKLINDAKTRAQGLSDSQKSSYENQFKTMLTPDQKQKIMDQLKKEGVTKESLQKDDTLAPAPNTTGTVSQSIQNNLTPEQKQKMLDALQGLNAGGQ